MLANFDQNSFLEWTHNLFTKVFTYLYHTESVNSIILSTFFCPQKYLHLYLFLFLAFSGKAIVVAIDLMDLFVCHYAVFRLVSVFLLIVASDTPWYSLSSNGWNLLARSTPFTCSHDSHCFAPFRPSLTPKISSQKLALCGSTLPTLPPKPYCGVHLLTSHRAVLVCCIFLVSPFIWLFSYVALFLSIFIVHRISIATIDEPFWFIDTFYGKDV